MNLLDNPFHILGVSTRSTKQDIIDSCEERSLTGDPKVCIAARSILITPRKRIAAEIGWLPGMAPNRARELLARIERKDSTSVDGLANCTGLIYCNLADALLSRDLVPEKRIKLVANRMIENFDVLDVEDLFLLINSDRETAGITPVLSAADLDDALQQMRKHYVDTIMGALNQLYAPDEVMTELVSEWRDQGTELPRLLEDLADSYEAEENVQKFLRMKAEAIGVLIDAIRKAAPLNDSNASMECLLDQLEKELCRWLQVARPIQMVKYSRGISDEQSVSLVGEVRSALVDIANDHGQFEAALRGSRILRDNFGELPNFQDQAGQDIATLEDLVKRRRQAEAEAKREHQERAREISLDLMIGNDRLVITPDTISYGGTTLRTDECTRIRWGVYKHYINGIRVNREFTVGVGTPNSEITIDCVRFMESETTVRNRYGTVIDKVWRAVGVRILMDMLSGLSQDKSYKIGAALVTRRGIELVRHKFLSSEPYFAVWQDLRMGHGSGTLVLSSASQKKTSVELSYRLSYNVPVLESLIEFLFKDGNYAKLERGEFR